MPEKLAFLYIKKTDAENPSSPVIIKLRRADNYKPTSQYNFTEKHYALAPYTNSKKNT